jgi:hypothetical protein
MQIQAGKAYIWPDGVSTCTGYWVAIEDLVVMAQWQ